MAHQVKLAIRMWLRNPGLALIAVAALALGIGANTAIFSVVNTILLRPLPYPNADRIGIVWEESPAQGWQRINVSGPNFVDIRERNRSFEDLVLMEVGTGTVTGFGEPQQFPGLRVTTNFLSFFGVKPEVGRDFQPGESWRDRVVILSHAAWMRWFGGDRSVVGRKVIADGLPYTIIGVTPASFWLPVAADAFVPWANADLRGKNRMDHDTPVMARLKPGVTWEQASRELADLETGFAQIEPRLKGWTARVYPMRDSLVVGIRPALLVLLGAVGLVLLIACTNIANLLLAKASAREREIAVRAALGASRGRLIRQFLTESMVLGLVGGVLGLFLAYWGVDVVNALVPSTIRLPDSNAQILRPEIEIDGMVLLFTLAASLGTGLLFGLAPAWTASRADLQAPLKEGTRGSSSGRKHSLQNALVVAEVALALVLLVGAMLTIRSFWNLQQVNPGFVPGNTLVMQTELPTDSKYRTAPEQARFFERVLAQIAQVPGTAAAGITCVLPFAEQDHNVSFRIEGRAEAAGGIALPAAYRSVSGGYFAAMGIAVQRGRGFTDRDDVDHPRVAVIDESLANRYWPTGREDPIGQRIRIGSRVLEIVGVVRGVRNAGLNREPAPMVYTSYLQYPEPLVSIVVRHPAPSRVVNAVKQAVYSVDPDQPVFRVATMGDLLSGSQSASRFTLGLLGAFAAVAMLLASLGIYGVISYAVAQRTTEIGIRMALGASAGQVMRMVVGRGLALSLVGVAIGLIGAVAASRALTSLLYGVSGHDPWILAGCAVLLAGVGVMASYLPARRALRIEPSISLRYE